MAISSEFSGVLIGMDEYTKENETTITYMVLIAQKADPKTGLYGAAEVCNVREKEPVLKDAKKDAKVRFFGELKGGKDSKYMAYSGIEYVK